MTPEIQEGNKLIAEFMGIEEIVPCVEVDKQYQLIKMKDGGVWTWDEFEYHTSWDWLIPIVEKIENEPIDISVVIKKNKCGIYLYKNTPNEKCLSIWEASSKIGAVWLAVIDFIKWYNKNNHP